MSAMELSSRSTLRVGVEDVRAAAARIRPVVRRTPLERSEALTARAGREVWLKLEALQRTGAFKLRGATNAVMLARAGETAAGGARVVTASAGNHGLGIASAARAAGVSATIFLPATAAGVKRDRILAMGAEVRPVRGGYDIAHAEAVRFAEERGHTYIHAYSDPDVVAGQGTVALEIVEDLPEVTTIVTPVGGGGLIAGTGIVARAGGWAEGRLRVVGVQSEATAAMYRSLEAGAVRSVPDAPTLCDGLAGDVDETTLALAQRTVDDMYLVSEAAVANAIRHLYVEEGVVAEGSAAVGVAAVLQGVEVRASTGPIVIVLTGSNIDAARLASLLEGGEE